MATKLRLWHDLANFVDLGRQYKANGKTASPIQSKGHISKSCTYDCYSKGYMCRCEVLPKRAGGRKNATKSSSAGILLVLPPNVQGILRIFRPQRFLPQVFLHATSHFLPPPQHRYG